VITSPQAPGLELTVVSEGGSIKLDVRGVERWEFKEGCARAGIASAGECNCAFEQLRAKGLIPETRQQINAGWQHDARAALSQCERQTGAATG
jgi:hypothetical protein